MLLASTWWLTRVAGETPSQRRIAEHGNTDPMMTSQVIRALEAKGLVRRDPDPADTRAKIVDVTPAGARLAKRAVRVVEDSDRQFFAAVADQGALIEILSALGR